MELSARMSSLIPYRKAADVLSEFLPIPSTKSLMILRHRTMKLGERLGEKACQRAWFEPPSSSDHKQVELDLPNDPEREFIVSIDTAHVRCSRSEKARTFEIAVARCGRGRRGSPPGHYFATADTSKRELRSRTLQALQHEGYVGRGEVTVISDGTEIMKRLPRALPKPTVHIIDWFHIAMKIQPMQQVADHIVRSRDEWTNETVILDEEIRASNGNCGMDRSIDPRSRRLLAPDDPAVGPARSGIRNGAAQTLASTRQTMLRERLVQFRFFEDDDSAGRSFLLRFSRQWERVSGLSLE